MFHVNHDETGARIHVSDPFATPAADRSAVRRLRGRLASPVTLWTAPGPAGLTVSSTVIADGEPGRVLGLIDDESELFDALLTAGRFAIIPLSADDQQLADRFAGLMPAPGGLFAGDGWTPTPFGPVPSGAGTWAGCTVDTTRGYGWGTLVEATVTTMELTAAPAPLLHYRGRYHRLTP
jgi:3-hydroxy-9,10-secoandrosta-1,3,5(10)-triene-9,17-dione monooxygenase reductase component